VARGGATRGGGRPTRGPRRKISPVIVDDHIDIYRLRKLLRAHTCDYTCRHLLAEDVQIIALAAKGYQIKQIAAALDMSPATIKNLLTRIYSFAGVKNKAEFIILLMRAGVV
jgi:DNA-binding CsgD family transcriptional regulator